MGQEELQRDSMGSWPWAPHPTDQRSLECAGPSEVSAQLPLSHLASWAQGTGEAPSLPHAAPCPPASPATPSLGASLRAPVFQTLNCWLRPRRCPTCPGVGSSRASAAASPWPAPGPAPAPGCPILPTTHPSPEPQAALSVCGGVKTTAHLDIRRHRTQSCQLSHTSPPTPGSGLCVSTCRSQRPTQRQSLAKGRSSPESWRHPFPPISLSPWLQLSSTLPVTLATIPHRPPVSMRGPTTVLQGRAAHSRPAPAPRPWAPALFEGEAQTCVREEGGLRRGRWHHRGRAPRTPGGWPTAHVFCM